MQGPFPRAITLHAAHPPAQNLNKCYRLCLGKLPTFATTGERNEQASFILG